MLPPCPAAQALKVPDDWCSGRIWARTKCSSASGAFTCESGDCGPSVQCSGTGRPPATLAEFTLGGAPGATADTYDISLVDGYNVGVKVTPVGGTKIPGERVVPGGNTALGARPNTVKVGR